MASPSSSISSSHPIEQSWKYDRAVTFANDQVLVRMVSSSGDQLYFLDYWKKGNVNDYNSYQSIAPNDFPDLYSSYVLDKDDRVFFLGNGASNYEQVTLTSLQLEKLSPVVSSVFSEAGIQRGNLFKLNYFNYPNMNWSDVSQTQILNLKEPVLVDYSCNESHELISQDVTVTVNPASSVWDEGFKKILATSHSDLPDILVSDNLLEPNEVKRSSVLHLGVGTRELESYPDYTKILYGLMGPYCSDIPPERPYGNSHTMAKHYFKNYENNPICTYAFAYYVGKYGLYYSGAPTDSLTQAIATSRDPTFIPMLEDIYRTIAIFPITKEEAWIGKIMQGWWLPREICETIDMLKTQPVPERGRWEPFATTNSVVVNLEPYNGPIKDLIERSTIHEITISQPIPTIDAASPWLQETEALNKMKQLLRLKKSTSTNLVAAQCLELTRLAVEQVLNMPVSIKQISDWILLQDDDSLLIGARNGTSYLGSVGSNIDWFVGWDQE